jgi:hypothetical protein
MKHNENDLKIRAVFEITDPTTGKKISRELITEYYPGHHVKDEGTVIRKCMKQVLADLSKLKPLEEKKA